MNLGRHANETETSKSSKRLSNSDLETYEVYAWECITLIRKDWTTFDLVIKDMNELLCLIHFVHRKIYHERRAIFDKTQDLRKSQQASMCTEGDSPDDSDMTSLI